MSLPPVVTGISPKEGPPGTRVTIRGEFLGRSAADLIGLKICGCDCLLSAEWKSKNKIVARSGPCKGRGDIVVTTKLGGEGTSTVQFRGYHESVGPVKESAVWVEEADLPSSLPWGRRSLSPPAYIPPDPLGLSTDGDDSKFPQDELSELFPDGSGKLSDENFQPGWYLLEHHSNTSFEDLKAGMKFLKRKVESQKEGELSFLKSNTGAVMEQLDRLVLLKNTFEEDQRKSGKEPLYSLEEAIEESVRLADSLFSEILSRKESAERTREALALITRHKFLFQLPASIDRNIRRKEYDLLLNDYTRVKNLFGNTDVKLFQKILNEVDKKIEELKRKLYARMNTMPIDVHEQIKYIRILISLGWEGDCAWEAILTRHRYLMELLDKVKAHFTHREDCDNNDKGGKRKSRERCTNVKREVVMAGDVRGVWCGAASSALSAHLHALWSLALGYCGGQLAGAPSSPQRQNDLKEMIIAAVERYSDHMRQCLMTRETMGGGGFESRLMADLRHLRDAYDALQRLDLPSQPLSIVERVIFEYRVFGMKQFLTSALHKVKGLAAAQEWTVVEYGAPAVTELPSQLLKFVSEAFTSIHKCVLPASRRERALFVPASASAAASASSSASTFDQPGAVLDAHMRQILLAYVAVLEELAAQNNEQELNNSVLSVALEKPVPLVDTQGDLGPRRLLLVAGDAQHTRRATLPEMIRLAARYGLPVSSSVLDTVDSALAAAAEGACELYLEARGDPLVGTVEPSMFVGDARGSTLPAPRPYYAELIDNLIVIHAEVEAVCGAGSARYMRDLCETVCEELARLAGVVPALTDRHALCTRLEHALLHIALATYLTPRARGYLAEALSGVPPLDDQGQKRLEELTALYSSRMAMQVACLNTGLETHCL